jgi:hypothetical protein
MSGQDLAFAVTKSNPYPVLLTVSPHVQAITILDKATHTTFFKLNISFAALGHFQQATALARLCAANSSGAQQVSGPEGASTDGMVCNHLWERPKKISAARLGQINMIATLS